MLSRKSNRTRMDLENQDQLEHRGLFEFSGDFQVISYK